MQKDNEYGNDYAEAYKLSEPEINLIIMPTLQAMVAGWDREKKVLDVGTGTGRQIRLLEKLGFQVFGIDNSINMLASSKNRQSHKIALMRDDAFAFSAQAFDYLTIGNVLQDFENKRDLTRFMQEVVRVLKPGGKILVTTPTPESYGVETVSFDASLYPGNLDSIVVGGGAPAKVLIKKTGEELTDYIWSPEDLRVIFASLGLRIKDYQTPLADGNANISWISETIMPAWALYLLQYDMR